MMTHAPTRMRSPAQAGREESTTTGHSGRESARQPRRATTEDRLRMRGKGGAGLKGERFSRVALEGAREHLPLPLEGSRRASQRRLSSVRP